MTIVLPFRPSVLPLPPTTHRSLPESAAKFLTVTSQLAQPGTIVLTARGEVDMASAPYLRDRLQGEIHHAGPDLIANLNDVSFFGAAGLDVLADVQEAASLAEIGFCVVARTRKILMPLRVTGLDLVLDVYPDLDHTPMRPWFPIGRR